MTAFDPFRTLAQRVLSIDCRDELQSLGVRSHRRLFIFRVMTCGVGAGGQVKAFDVVHEADIAGDIITSCGQIVWPEVPLSLKIGELRVDAFFCLLRSKSGYLRI